MRKCILSFILLYWPVFEHFLDLRKNIFIICPSTPCLDITHITIIQAEIYFPSSLICLLSIDPVPSFYIITIILSIPSIAKM